MPRSGRRPAIWDAASCAERTRLVGHTEALNGVVFAPSGNQVITASEDNTARIWDVRSAKPIATFSGHKGLLTALAISPDGARIATASRDRTVRLWKTATRTAPVTLSTHTEEVWAVAISRDGRRLASGGKDCLILVHTLDPADLVRSARVCAGRELSSEERDRYLGGADELDLPGDLR